MDPQVVDLLVVGAGMSGIAAAKFYLEIHPDHKVVILEQDRCLGGVWSSRRLYEGFWTQWTVGTAEYSDMRMDRPPEEDIYHEFFKAKHTTKYLEEYVNRHSFAGQSLHDRIKFGYKVQTIKKLDEKWVVSGGGMNTDETNTFHASKLIVASGLTSEPNIPDLPGKDNFEAPVVHQDDFGQSSVLTSTDIEHVTILGGGKSAADMAYVSVKAGKSVSWIIRASGTGPGFFLTTKGKGPYKNAFELGSIRMTSTLSPSILNPNSSWARLLYGTKFGRKLVTSVWAAADKQILEDMDIEGRQAKKGFEKLKPQTPVFWQNGTGGLLNREDFWETIAPNVQVYEGDILELDKHVIRLKNGEEVPSDVLLCGTGWQSSFDYFDSDLLVRLGLPHFLKDEPAEDAEAWSRLEKQADQEVLEQFPLLANPPEHPRLPVQKTPYRLYNGIAPLGDDSIAFIGYVTIANYFTGVECQAIWATAYLDKQLVLPSLKDKQIEVARMNAFCRRRYLSNGERGNFLPFESVRYTDKLLHETGLSSHRNGWFKDNFVPSTSQNLASLKKEYIAKYGSDVSQPGEKLGFSAA